MLFREGFGIRSIIRAPLRLVHKGAKIRRVTLGALTSMRVLGQLLRR